MDVKQLAASLEEAFCSVRGQDIALGGKLKHIAGEVRRLSPAFAEAADAFVARLEQVAAGSLAPQPGEKMPPFMLPDEKGRFVTLEKLLAQGPVE